MDFPWIVLKYIKIACLKPGLRNFSAVKGQILTGLLSSENDLPLSNVSKELLILFYIL